MTLLVPCLLADSTVLMLKTTLCRLKGLTTWEWCSLRGCIQPHCFVLSTWGIQSLRPVSRLHQEVGGGLPTPLMASPSLSKRLIILTWCAHGNKYLIIKKVISPDSSRTSASHLYLQSRYIHVQFCFLLTNSEAFCMRAKVPDILFW